MKITKITATPVNIYLEAPLMWSVGLYPGTSKTIVEVETDQGLTGLGEAPSPDCVDLINKQMGPALIGREALDIAALERIVLPEWRIVQNTDDASVVKAFGSIEMALWDLRGKFWEQPLYMLLGGASRKAALFTEYFGFRLVKDGVGGERTPEEVADFCQKMAEEYGSTVFEGKLCQGDPLLEINTVKAIRERLGPAATIRLDANMGW
jgi:glucarate dehydratase